MRSDTVQRRPVARQLYRRSPKLWYGCPLKTNLSRVHLIRRKAISWSIATICISKKRSALALAWYVSRSRAPCYAGSARKNMPKFPCPYHLPQLLPSLGCTHHSTAFCIRLAWYLEFSLPLASLLQACRLSVTYRPLPQVQIVLVHLHPSRQRHNRPPQHRL